MICQRCGNCCLTMDVFIRHGDRALLKPGGALCPYLSFDGPQASCAVHQEPWYEGTPCFIYGNPDIDPDFAFKRGRPCQIGEYIVKAGGLQVVKPDQPRPKLEELQDYAQWEDWR